jgi:hypothetical protein
MCDWWEQDWEQEGDQGGREHLDYKVFPEESIGLLQTARAHGSCSRVEKPRRVCSGAALSYAEATGLVEPAERLQFVVAVTDSALDFGLPVDS